MCGRPLLRASPFDFGLRQFVGAGRAAGVNRFFSQSPLLGVTAINELDDKQRAREQWSKDPAGSVYGSKYEFGTREFFDQVERHRYQEYAPWMSEVMGFSQFAGARLLEVGCGMGTDLLQFARGGALCTGVDLTPRSIEITRRRFALYGERGNFLIGDGERLPFADATLDVVY